MKIISNSLAVTLLTASSIFISACNPEHFNDAENSEKIEQRLLNSNGKTITIYSSKDKLLLEHLLQKYSNQTGTKIELITDTSDILLSRLEEEGADTDADMILTINSGNLWQASKKGLLQQINSPIIDENIPSKYRDEESRWAGLSLDARTIFYNSEKVSPSNLSTYEDLASPKWKGKLCLQSHTAVINQSLISSMIEHLGVDTTELTIKGWSRNLATANFFSDDTELLNAIVSGECTVGIASSYNYGQLLDKTPDLPVKIFLANQNTTGLHVNLSGAGVVVNADNPSGALDLIEFLSSDDSQHRYLNINKEYPVNGKIDAESMLASWGAFKAHNIEVSKFDNLQFQTIQLIEKLESK